MLYIYSVTPDEIILCKCMRRKKVIRRVQKQYPLRAPIIIVIIISSTHTHTHQLARGQ